MRDLLKNCREVARQTPFQPMSNALTKIDIRTTCSNVARAKTNVLAKG